MTDRERLNHYHRRRMAWIQAEPPKWMVIAPVPFKPDGHTVHDFDRRFALEDEGIVNPIHPFRWAMLDGEVQLRF